MTGEESEPPCMPLREPLGLPRGAGRSLNTGLGDAFLRLRGHGLRGAQKWESGQAGGPPEEDQGAEWQELTS